MCVWLWFSMKSDEDKQNSVLLETTRFASEETAIYIYMNIRDERKKTRELTELCMSCNPDLTTYVEPQANTPASSGQCPAPPPTRTFRFTFDWDAPTFASDCWYWLSIRLDLEEDSLLARDIVPDAGNTSATVSFSAKVTSAASTAISDGLRSGELLWVTNSQLFFLTVVWCQIVTIVMWCSDYESGQGRLGLYVWQTPPTWLGNSCEVGHLVLQHLFFPIYLFPTSCDASLLLRRFSARQCLILELW